MMILFYTLYKQKIHKEGIMHRDLKAENIYIVHESPLKLKIGDFGLCCNVSKRSTNCCGTLHNCKYFFIILIIII